MARVRVRMGDNEVEVDSRDFYVDNETVGRIVSELSLFTGRYGDVSPEGAAQSPARVEPKLEELVRSDFFDRPRTATETVGKLHEEGLLPNPLAVSRALLRMALSRRLSRNTRDRHVYYSAIPSMVG